MDQQKEDNMRKYIRIITACIAATTMTMASVVTTSAISWKQDGNGWWFENTDGTYVSNAWKQINGKRYVFDNQGYMRTGWFQENGKWYYLDNSGAMRTGWIKGNEKWYYLDNSGAMQTGWVKENGKWYYLDSSGTMQTGWVKENGKWYYLAADGVCFINTITPDGYMVDANGAWINSSFFLDNYDKYEDSNEDEDSDTYEEPTTSQEEESTTDKEEPTTSQDEESKKPSLEEVVKAYRDFIWYGFGMDEGDDNYLFIDLNNDGIPECMRRHNGKSNEPGIRVGILTYSEGAVFEGNQNCSMLFEDICIPFYYVEGGNAFYNYLGGQDGGERVFHKINDKGKFEFMGTAWKSRDDNSYHIEKPGHVWGNPTEVSKEEYDNYINSFGEFTEISLKYEDTYRSIDAAYEAYLSEIGKNENTENDVLSESKVYEAIINMQSEYPEGMEWTNDNSYSWNGGIYSGGQGCAGFAFLLSDAAFGDLPAREYTKYDPSTIKVGDIIRINNDSHSVIVLTVDEDGVTVAEGNYNQSIHWGRSLTHEQLTNADYIITRYQES